MHAWISAPIFLTAALLAAACTRQYSGDGTFTDLGRNAYAPRYRIDLGPVDLSQRGTYRFRISGLPSTRFLIGLTKVDISSGCDSKVLGAVRIRVLVGANDGTAVVFQEAPLRDWVTSPNLLYRRGVEHTESLGNGQVQLFQDGGSGFAPNPDESYSIFFDVLEADGVTGCKSHLVAIGGGRYVRI
jgi:hypothetical protein